MACNVTLNEFHCYAYILSALAKLNDRREFVSHTAVIYGCQITALWKVGVRRLSYALNKLVKFSCWVMARESTLSWIMARQVKKVEQLCPKQS